MKKFAIVLCVGLVGCAPQFIVEPKFVDVDRPVLFCPPLDEIVEMPRIDLQTLKLSEADRDKPGKVARAYNIDMNVLTQRLAELNRIEAERVKAAAEMRKKLKEYQEAVQKVHDANKERITREVLEKQKALNEGQ